MRAITIALAAVLLAASAASAQAPADYLKRVADRYRAAFDTYERNGVVERSAVHGDLFFGPRFDDIDINRDGVINASDRADAIANNFAKLPVGQPSLPVGPSPAAADAVVVSAAKSGGSGISALAVVRSRDAAAVESRIVARVRNEVRAATVDSFASTESGTFRGVKFGDRDPPLGVRWPPTKSVA